jgi:hypothetical protein
MLSSRENYEQFIYTLTERYPQIKFSTLVLKMLSPYDGQLMGEIHFAQEIVLSVSETVNFRDGRIQQYSYAVFRSREKLYWYDSQPHPHDPLLQSTHPHHKHIPPDIKHHRILAPGISFVQPNLPFLIQEVEETLLSPMIESNEPGSSQAADC